jgi:hypothetical protein
MFLVYKNNTSLDEVCGSLVFNIICPPKTNTKSSESLT